MRGDAAPTRRRAPRSRGSVSAGNSSTDGKVASLATSSESFSGTRGTLVRAVRQEEAEASVDSESSSCSSKLTECDSERRPFDTCVDESKRIIVTSRPSPLELNREKRSGTRPSVGNSSTDRKIASLAISCESSSGTRGAPFRAVKQEEAKASVDSKSSSCSSKLVKCDSERRPLDICVDESKCVVFTLQPSLLELNREKRRNRECSRHVLQKKYLRPGMVLLKGFIAHHDQVSIIKKCRELGIGAGGFYTPGYSDGAKLHPHMMCLGKNWDPETSSYEEKRLFDGAVPPQIPQLFKKLVENAIRASHCFLSQEEGVIDVEEELPWMSPDICIVNFYSDSGRLGLHQDKDESKSSLLKGLPVVSFSLGDSAEFLYGVDRDAAKAERVELESGDVLLFGGKSRNIFHGVPCIKPKTAPKRLIEGGKLRPGRLNLTFRQY